MIILEPSESQDECSSLKQGSEIDTSAAPATAPPPYVLNALPNPIPSYQAIPQSHPSPSRTTLRRRRSRIRRLLAAFVIISLLLLLWGAFMRSFHKPARHSSPGGHRYNYGYKPVRLFAIHPFF